MCDVLKLNKSEFANMDFEIKPYERKHITCFLLLLLQNIQLFVQGESERTIL